MNECSLQIRYNTQTQNLGAYFVERCQTGFLGPMSHRKQIEVISSKLRKMLGEKERVLLVG